MYRGPSSGSFRSTSSDVVTLAGGRSITVSLHTTSDVCNVHSCVREDVLSAALDAGTAIGTIIVYFWYVASLISLSEASRDR